ncbi:MAG: hypothetical protein DHS20C18_39110 [Saprospiraceae bacterium]|nr:MAG: hypothetical protein DHS20C18_39110 [Saprospiraceae bacterium]
MYAQKTQDEKAIQQVVETMITSWGEGNGEKFASIFADEHDFIVWTGYYIKNSNPTVNARAHQGIFNTIYKDTDLYSTIDKIKFIREDIALIHVLGAVSKKGEGRPTDPEVLWTGILEKKDNTWKIISFHNLDLEVFKDENIKNNAPMPPEVMYASWYANTENK